MREMSFEQVITPILPFGDEDPTRVVEIKNFLPKEQADILFKNLENIPYQQGIVENPELKTSGYRRTQVKWINFEERFSDLWSFLHREIAKINKDLWKFNLSGIEEIMQYTEYDAQYKGHYDWHIDVGHEVFSNRRKLSMIIQLSKPEDYEGGDVLVYKGGKKPESYSKEQYSAIFFPSFLLHKVTPVTKGNRKSLVLWIGGCPFK